MNLKRSYPANGIVVNTRPQKVFKPFPQNTRPMVMYRTPSQFKSLTNPPQGRIWPEKKDITLQGSLGILGPGAWSELDFLTGIPTGPNPQERIGRKVQLKSITIRWFESSTSPSSLSLRVLVVYDKSPEQLLPSIQEVVNNDFNGLMNLTNSDRFIVLSDQIHQPIGSTSSTGFVRSDMIYKKLNLPAMYASNGAAITDITTGAIYIMCCYPFGLTGNGIAYRSRVRYTDV